VSKHALNVSLTTAAAAAAALKTASSSTPDCGELALTLVGDMPRAGVVPDAVTYATVLRALHVARRHTQLLALWSGIDRRLKAQPALACSSMYRLLLRACEQVCYALFRYQILARHTLCVMEQCVCIVQR
jgi:hypothetical protein